VLVVSAARLLSLSRRGGITVKEEEKKKRTNPHEFSYENNYSGFMKNL